MHHKHHMQPFLLVVLPAKHICLQETLSKQLHPPCTSNTTCSPCYWSCYHPSTTSCRKSYHRTATPMHLTRACSWYTQLHPCMPPVLLPRVMPPINSNAG